MGWGQALAYDLAIESAQVVSADRCTWVSAENDLKYFSVTVEQVFLEKLSNGDNQAMPK